MVPLESNYSLMGAMVPLESNYSLMGGITDEEIKSHDSGGH
jgi:hypothetical protein